MNTEICNAIISLLADKFNSEQLHTIEAAIYSVLYNYSITQNNNETALISEISPDVKAVQMFFISKKIEGCSIKTLNYYKNEIKQFLQFMNKQLNAITTDDLRFYFATRENVTKTTIKNKRGVLSSLFAWLTNEGHLQKNPMLRVNTIRFDKNT